MADRILEMDLAAVDADAAGVADRVGDVLRGHRTEQPAVVARLLRDRQNGAAEQRRVLLSALFGLALGVIRGLKPTLRCLDRACGRRLGKLAGLEEAPQVART